MVMAKKKISKEKPKWVELPVRPIESWMGEWIVSSMVLNAYYKKKKVPKALGVVENCMTENPDGSGNLAYEVKF
jgi:hypothetical protein